MTLAQLQAALQQIQGPDLPVLLRYTDLNGAPQTAEIGQIIEEVTHHPDPQRRVILSA